MPPKPSAPHHDLHAALQGVWHFHSLEMDGAPLPATMLGQSQLRMDRDRFHMQSPGANYAGLFTIDPTQTPPHLDIHFHEGPEAGRTSQGIFTLDNNRLTICLGLTGAPRPTAFRTTPGSRHALEVLHRAPLQPAAPEPSANSEPTPARDPIAARDPAAPEPAAPLPPTLAQLQGEWLPVEIINSGVRVPTSMLPMGRRIQTGDETKVTFGGQTLIHARLRFDEDASPTAVDYLHLSGPAAGSVSQGIFQWDSAQALFCISAPGAPARKTSPAPRKQPHPQPLETLTPPRPHRRPHPHARPQLIQHLHQPVHRKPPQLPIPNPRKIRRRHPRPPRRPPHRQPLPIQPLHHLRRQHRLALIDIRVLMPQLAKHMPPPTYNLQARAHLPISFLNHRTRSRIRSTSRFGVLMPCVDFF